ncbi:hypothetical protein ABUL39_00550 [Rhodothermus marinus]|uniref:hypothetical protein n=1 Tax=Rhodothermus marinus TaxID=29549 RepID=UPI0037C660ED
MKRRFPLLALGMVALLAGLAAGLERLDWQLGVAPSLALLHGPLMISGFFGTLISLERAVALDRPLAYAVPALCGLGALLTLAGSRMAGPLLLTLGSLGLAGIFAAALRIQRASFLLVMAAGAVALIVGNAAWLLGQPVPAVVPWWMAFLVLTIAGERLELSRMLLHGARVEHQFLGIVGLYGLSLLLTFIHPPLAWHLTGAALILLALWLLRYDVARHTVRQSGLTRFIAWCLLLGYGWLVVGGLVMLVRGQLVAGPWYDAALHAVLVGFVFSMVFGHAPIIFPSVLGVPVAWRPFFYGHLVLLHAALLVRLVGDVAGLLLWRRWGGLLNALAILIFLGVTVGTTWVEQRRRRKQTFDTYA